MSESEEYNKLVERKEEVEKAIKEFEESAIIKDYLELTEENKNLNEKQLLLYEDMKKEEYASCDQIQLWLLIVRNWG